MKLNLKKPLAIFDLETTGVDVATDRIVEISIVKIHVNGNKEVITKRINPTIPIPFSSSLVHGIYDDDIKNEPTFKQMASYFKEILTGCDLAGYNLLKFDVPLLMEEFLRNDIDFDLSKCNIVDVQKIFHMMEPRTLAAAYKFYCQKELINAHSAEADTIATFEILEAQLDRYEKTTLKDEKGNEFTPIVNDIQHLSSLNRTYSVDLAGRIVYNDKNEEVFNFGKHKGKSVKGIFQTEPSYYDWMMKSDFPLFTKKILTQLKLKYQQQAQ